MQAPRNVCYVCTYVNVYVPEAFFDHCMYMNDSMLCVCCTPDYVASHIPVVDYLSHADLAHGKYVMKDR